MWSLGRGLGAQPPQPSHPSAAAARLGAAAGWALPAGELARSWSGGPHLAASALLGAPGRKRRVRLDLEAARLAGRRGASPLQLVGALAHLVLGAGDTDAGGPAAGSGRQERAGGGGLRSYLVLSAGAHRLSQGADATGSGARWSLGAGAGVRAPAGEAELALEARHHVLLPFSLLGLGGFGLRFTPLSLGVRF